MREYIDVKMRQTEQLFSQCYCWHMGKSNRESNFV